MDACYSMILRQRGKGLEDFCEESAFWWKLKRKIAKQAKLTSL